MTTSRPFVFIQDPPLHPEIAEEKIRSLEINSPLVLSASNYNYVSSELLQNFLCSISKASPGVLRRFLFLALDSSTDRYLADKFPEVNTFAADQYWNITKQSLRNSSAPTSSYHLFIIKKAAFILKTLDETSLNILWTDSDLVWLQDVVKWFVKQPVGCDVMFTDDDFWPFSFINKLILPIPNAGFYYARNTLGTRRLFEIWLGKMVEEWRAGHITKEQFALKDAILQIWREGHLQIKLWGEYPEELDPSKITICFLPRDKYPHFDKVKSDTVVENGVAVVHPNFGQKEKKDIFLRDGFWFWNARSKRCVNRHNALESLNE